MIVNGATLGATQIGYRAAFSKAYELAVPEAKQFYLEVPSTKKTEVYKWLGSLPTMRKWVDEPVFESLDAYSWQIENEYWQCGLRISRDDIADDNLGLVMPTVRQLGKEAKRHPGQLIYDLINQGDQALGYDGQFFFDTDHRDGTGPIQGNRYSGALSVGALRAMRTGMRKLKDHRGRPLNIKMTHILVPPDLEGAAKDVIEADKLANGATNTEYKAVTPIVSPYLESPVKWYGFDLSGDNELRPFLFQNREGPYFVAKDQPTDEAAFYQRDFLYNVWGRWNAGYGLWQFAAMSTGVP